MVTRTWQNKFFNEQNDSSVCAFKNSGNLRCQRRGSFHQGFNAALITNFVRQSSYGAVGDIKYIQPSAKLLLEIQVHFCNGLIPRCCCPDCLDSYSQKYRFIYVIDYFLVVRNKVPNILVLQTLSFACLSFPCFGCITKR